MPKEVLELTKAMVAIPSVNPQEKSAVQSPYGEAQIAEFICSWLKKNNLDAKIQQAQPNRPNVTAFAPGQNKDKTLLLSGHMDTVDIQQMSIEPFEPQIKDNRLYGRGSCDTKGPLAAIMIAFRDRVNAGNLPYNLAFLATCGEEYNTLGSCYYAEKTDTKPTSAIFAEPTNLKVVVAHKGIVRLLLTCFGKSAHSATPKLGDNAIYTMNKAILAVKRFANKLTYNTEHPLLGTETLSLTTIKGGQQINIIPDKCRAELDWRTIPGHTPQQCLDQLQKAISEQLPQKKFELELLLTYNPMQTEPSDPFIQALLDAVEKTTKSRQTTSVPYGTDASPFTHLNIPMAIFGPGNPDKAHTADEFIEIKQLEKGLEAYNNFLNSNWILK